MCKEVIGVGIIKIPFPLLKSRFRKHDGLDYGSVNSLDEYVISTRSNTSEFLLCSNDTLW